MKKHLLAAVLMAAFFISASAAAEPICLPRHVLKSHLAAHYSEFVIAQGVNNKGALTEVYATASRHRWTVVETNADGLSCMKAAGEYWNMVPLENRRSAARPASGQLDVELWKDNPDG